MSGASVTAEMFAETDIARLGSSAVEEELISVMGDGIAEDSCNRIANHREGFKMHHISYFNYVLNNYETKIENK